MNNIKKGYLLMTGFSIFVMIAYLSVDFIYRHYPEISPENMIFWGFLGTLLVFTPLLTSSKRKRETLKQEFRSHKKLIIGAAFLTAIGAFLWFWAIKESSSGPISLLGRVDILFSFLLGVFLLNEKVSWREIPGIILAIIGLFLIANLEGEVTRLAVIVILISKFLYSLQSLFVKKYGQKIHSFSFAFLRTLFMFLFLALVFLLQRKIVLIPLPAFLIVAGGQVCGVLLGRILYFEAHKFLDVSKLNVFLVLGPMLTVLGAFLIFGDPISGQKLLGTVLIIIGVLAFTREQIKISNT